MPLTLRVATAADAAALAALAGELGYPTTSEEMAARLADVLPRKDHHVLVCEDDRIAGWIQLEIQHTLDSGAFAEIVGLIVTSSRRGLGVGTRLVAAAEQWALAQGMDKLRVAANIIRERTHAFYRKHGFVETKLQKMFQKSLNAAC